MADIINADRIMELHVTHMKELCRLRELMSADGEDGVLLAMLHDDRDMLSGDLVGMTGLTSGRVANILKKLEEKKLIIRTNDAVDKRKVHVRMTDLGCERAQKLTENMKSTYAEFMRYLGEEDTASAAHLLQRIIEYYGGQNA